MTVAIVAGAVIGLIAVGLSTVILPTIARRIWIIRINKVRKQINKRILQLSQDLAVVKLEESWLQLDHELTEKIKSKKAFNGRMILIRYRGFYNSFDDYTGDLIKSRLTKDEEEVKPDLEAAFRPRFFEVHNLMKMVVAEYGRLFQEDDTELTTIYLKRPQAVFDFWVNRLAKIRNQADRGDYITLSPKLSEAQSALEKLIDAALSVKEALMNKYVLDRVLEKIGENGRGGAMTIVPVSNEAYTDYLESLASAGFSWQVGNFDLALRECERTNAIYAKFIQAIKMSYPEAIS